MIKVKYSKNEKLSVFNIEEKTMSKSGFSHQLSGGNTPSSVDQNFYSHHLQDGKTIYHHPALSRDDFASMFHSSPSQLCNINLTLKY